MTTLLKKLSFSERLGTIKSMFKKAYDESSSLYQEMQQDIDKKTQQMVEISKDIDNTRELQNSTKEFMFNLEKFI